MQAEAERRYQIGMRLLWATAFVVVFISGILTAFTSQAASPNYYQLFVSIVPVAAVHFLLSFVLSMKTTRWTRRIIIGFSSVVFLFFAEMALRVLL